jgi:hypothetical protein
MSQAVIPNSGMFRGFKVSQQPISQAEITLGQIFY